MYNLTNVTNSNNLLELMVASNQLANNSLFVMVTIVLWIIIVMAMVNRGVMPAIATASFITGLSGILLVLSGLISDTLLVYYVLGMALAVSAAFIAGKGE